MTCACLKVIFLWFPTIQARLYFKIVHILRPTQKLQLLLWWSWEMFIVSILVILEALLVVLHHWYQNLDNLSISLLQIQVLLFYSLLWIRGCDSTAFLQFCGLTAFSKHKPGSIYAQTLSVSSQLQWPRVSSPFWQVFLLGTFHDAIEARKDLQRWR